MSTEVRDLRKAWRAACENNMYDEKLKEKQIKGRI